MVRYPIGEQDFRDIREGRIFSRVCQFMITIGIGRISGGSYRFSTDKKRLDGYEIKSLKQDR